MLTLITSIKALFLKGELICSDPRSWRLKINNLDWKKINFLVIRIWLKKMIVLNRNQIENQNNKMQTSWVIDLSIHKAGYATYLLRILPHRHHLLNKCILCLRKSKRLMRLEVKCLMVLSRLKWKCFLKITFKKYQKNQIKINKISIKNLRITKTKY